MLMVLNRVLFLRTYKDLGFAFIEKGDTFSMGAFTFQHANSHLAVFLHQSTRHNTWGSPMYFLQQPVNVILVFRKCILKTAWVRSQDPRQIYKSGSKACALFTLIWSPADETALMAGDGAVSVEAITEGEAYLCRHNTHRLLAELRVIVQMR